MSALTTKRMGQTYVFRVLELTLASGNKAYHNGRACISGGKAVPASSAPGLVPIGKFVTNPADLVDATSGDMTVSVDFEEEHFCEWWANATSSDAVAATDIGKMAYMLDDQTVTITSTGRSPAGRIWGVDSVKGVLIEAPSETVHAKGTLSQQTLPAYASNDSAPTSLEQDAVYDVPTTAANSTITLPEAAPDGTRVFFLADGTKNGHTITYRDATGPVSLNTATTASKRHLATAIKNLGKWAVSVTVAP